MLGGGARACARLIGHPGAERVRVKALTLGKHVFTQSEGDMASAIEFGAVQAAACLASDDVNCRSGGRVLLDIARCVDFEKYPKAVDDFRSQGTIARIARARDDRRDEGSRRRRRNSKPRWRSTRSTQCSRDRAGMERPRRRRR